MRAIESAQQTWAPDSADGALHAQAAQRIATLYRQRVDRHAGHDAGAPQRGEAEDIERALRLLALRAERDEILSIGHQHGIQDITPRKLVREIDLQEGRYSA